MGAKYTTIAASGYNSSPPADDGSQVAANLITWAGIKTKLGDPVKTEADAINTALVSAFDYSCRQITTSDSTVASDHMRCVEIAPTVTTAVTISLGDAATMTNVYRVFIKNSSAIPQTLTRVTGGDTLDGVAASVVLAPGEGRIVQTNNAANGYITSSRTTPFAHGADIASATTTSLDTATGDLVDVTGTTTITAITLAEGKCATVRFTGALTLTNGASLVLPGGANITTAAGDYAVFRGYATSVVRCVAYVKASGAPVTLSPITNSLSADVGLGNTGTYFTGPTVAQGTAGTWWASGTVVVKDTAGAAEIRAKLWDGTTVISSAVVSATVASAIVTISLSGFIASPAGNIRISVIDVTSTSANILFNATGNSKDSTLSAVRIG